MEDIRLLYSWGIGLTLGGLLFWLWGRSKARQVREHILAQSDAEIAILQGRAQDREAQLQELKDSLRSSQEELKEMHGRLQAEAERRAAAEEKGHRVPGLEAQTAELLEENSALQKQLAELSTRLEEERKAAQEKQQLLAEAQIKLSDAFKALAAEALKSNNQSFLELARASLEKYQEGAKNDLDLRQKTIDGLVKPVQESLSKVDGKLQELEKVRLEAYSTLTEQVRSLAHTQTGLKDETSKLVQALRTPTVRGRWGEIQLRRVVEIAGMLPYCDFIEQAVATSDDGRLRPDLIVKLPGDKNVVVDAKAPLQSYLHALEAQEESRRLTYLKSHARHIRDHMARLSSKNYWEQFQPTPEFVVMFLPGESFFSAALEQDPGLIEEGVSQRVIPASPTTIIALLRAVAYGWRQEKVAQSAQEVSNLGRELYDRLGTFTGYLEKMGRGLDQAIDNFNRAVGSLENRVLISARKFSELGAGTTKEIPLLSQVEKVSRAVTVLETKE
jgi:DNA recombination protein RmuC